MDKASSPVGRFRGTVVHGDGRGRTLGYPTANLWVVDTSTVPDDGIYACQVTVHGDDAPLNGTLSIGSNPTFLDGPERHVEVHLHDADANLYGTTVTVQVCARLRDTERFDSAAELIAQTRADVALSREVLRHPGACSEAWRGASHTS